MRNFQIKIYLMGVVALSFVANALAQEISADRLSTSSDQRSSPDVIEIETEIGGTQIKSSDIVDKPKIKPRSDYSAGKINRKESSSPQSSASNIQRPTPNPQSLIPSDQSPRSSVQRPTSNVQQLTPTPNDRARNVRGSAEPPVARLTEDATSEGMMSPSVARPLTNSQPPAEAITDEQIVAMSMSLRKLIEDNSKLKNNLADLDHQLRTIRGQQMLDSNRLTEVSLERDALKKQNENIIAVGSEAQQRLQVLQQELTQKEQDYSLQIVRLQTELAQKLRDNESQPPPASSVQPPASNVNRSVSVDLVSVPNSEAAKQRGEKILLALDNVTQEQKKLAQDEAKVHYNMGNTYFNQGDYIKAAEEYARALELSPEDANAHYNLAFVGGEFLHDPKIALDHYKKYLFLNPHAEDAEMVRQKVVEAEIAVKGDVHFKSKINEELRKKKNDTNIWD